ncbi:MAG: ABC transporter permease, partial [Acidobacteria bacterium]|nr:ABC transporter permease [Acidobacteriota bacterium]
MPLVRRWLDDLGRDMRHSFRGLGRSPGLAATLIFVLALGIGANTAMFGIIHGMLIRPLPYPDGERIVRVGQAPRPMPGAPVYLSARAMAQVEDEAESFEQFAAHEGAVFPWTSPDGARPWGMAVSPALLRLLGAMPRLGRLFTDEEARQGADGVVLLSYGAWTRRFGANPNVVGTVVDVRGERRTVVGVLAEGFYFPSPREEVWTPFVLPPDAPTVVVLGRLREGVSAGQAATEVRAILQRMEGAADRLPTGGASGRPSGDSQNRVRVIPLREEMVGEYRPALAALTAATALVLLIACINVAGLLLARGVSRQRTLAVCTALGAGRGRIVRQLLTESMVLSLGGGALGLAAAVVVFRAVPALVPGDIVRLDEASLDG